MLIYGKERTWQQERLSDPFPPPPLNSFLKPAKSFISTAQQSQNKLSFDFGWAEGEEIPEGQEATATERKD